MILAKQSYRGGRMRKQSAEKKYTPNVIWPVFEHYLSSAVVGAFLAQLEQRFYQRLFCPWLVIWGFLFQRLNEDHSCDGFVSHLSSDVTGVWRNGQKAMSENNSAYIQARKRLPRKLARQVLRHTAQTIAAQWGEDGLWQNRMVYLLDGSTLRVQATEELLSYYGCPSGGKGASHWPVMRVMAAFHLWSGVVGEVIEAAHDASEYDMAVQLFRAMPGGVVWVGDAMFGIYRMLQVIVDREQDALIRLQAKDIGRWAHGRSLPTKTDEDVLWSPSPADHPECGVPIRPIQGRFIYVRIEHDGFRPLPIYLFTTLTDRERYPLEAILQLYARRWGVELDLRAVKTTLEMEELDGKSLDIVRKELYLGLTAYNLIRVLMLEAAIHAGCAPLQLSFARCWRRIKDTGQSLAFAAPWLSLSALDQLYDQLLTRLAACRLPNRKLRRFEPRAVWGRPKPFPYLKGSRQEARKAVVASFMES